jgi:hypothetical protein
VGKIKTNRDEQWRKAKDRAVALFPKVRQAPQPTVPAARATEIRAEWSRITSAAQDSGMTVLPDQAMTTPQRKSVIPGRWARITERLSADTSPSGDKKRALARGIERLFANIWPSGDTWLSAEELKILAAPDTSLNAIMSQARPPRPKEVDQSFVDSVEVLNAMLATQTLDETILVRLDEEEREVRASGNKLLARGLSEQAVGLGTRQRVRPVEPRGHGGFIVDVLRTLETVFSNETQLTAFREALRSPPCNCCGAPPTLMIERSARGLEALYRHAARVEQVCRQFLASAIPADQKHLFMRVVVPTYNATNFDSRRCVECGKVFALETGDEFRRSRYCPAQKGAKRSACQQAAEHRARIERQRRRTFVDAERDLQRIGKALLSHRCESPGACHPLDSPCAAAKRAGAGRLARLAAECQKLAPKGSAFGKLAPRFKVEGRDQSEDE